MKTISCDIQPMLCGSAFKNKGIQRILDAIIEFLPSPLDTPDIKGESKNGEVIIRKVLDTEKFSALAFKVMADPFVGQLIFFRVYSGVISSGDLILNSTRNKKERLGRILQMHANNREEIKKVGVGDIAAAVGLKDVKTGDTLCDPSYPIILEKINFPEPVISQSLEIKNKSDQEKVNSVLSRLMHEDPSFRSYLDIESNQTIISGMGELHLEILVERMRREFDLDLIIGKPKVAYRETIKSFVKNVEGKYIRQSGGRGQYGHVVINMGPNIKGGGYKFVDEIKGGVIPKEYISVIEKSIKDSLKVGVLAGYPVLDVIVYLVYGSYHEVDSNENAFKIAASIAFKEAMKKSDPILLEPIMTVDVELPECYMGLIIGDISSRRGVLLGIEDLFDNVKIIKSSIPLSEMFGYSTSLRSLTQGRALYNMVFNNYSEVPKNLYHSII